jgi:PAS domain S-box-containing protein
LLSTDGIALASNRAALDLSGLRPDEVKGKPFSTMLRWGPGPGVQTGLREAMTRAANGEAARYCVEVRGKKGHRQTTAMEFHFRPVLGDGNRVAFVLAEGRPAAEPDISDRLVKQKSERLNFAEAAGGIGTWEWDRDKQAVTWSRELYRIFAIDPSQPEAEKIWASRVHPSDWKPVERLMQEGWRLGSLEFEYRYQHPEAGLRWLFCKGCKFLPEKRMFGIVQDVTVGKLADVASERLAATVESSEDAIVSKDLKAIITSWNPGAERMFGYTAAEIIGRSIRTIIAPELYADEDKILATIARGERIEHFETMRVKKSGERIEISLTVSPVKDHRGRIIGAAKIARDMTQYKKTESALQTSERLASVGRLAATVAHEINNPLEAVTNLVYLAQRTSDSGELEKYLSIVDQELERISQLTKQTLGFYRETTGSTQVRLGEVIDSLISVFESRTRNNGIELRREIFGDPKLNTVPGEIRQLIANFLSNSIDALQAGGRIVVRVSSTTQQAGQPRPGVRISVADTGSGIASPARAKIFEPFFTTKKDIGTGLGLWICKNVVENHHGSIRVRSDTTPGRSWTVFSVFLPIEQGPANTGEPILPALRRVAAVQAGA